MVTIADPELHVEHVPHHQGDRMLIVTYRLEVLPEEALVGGVVQDEVVVTACDEHDAPVAPADIELRFGGEYVIDDAGVLDRRVEHRVHRVLLDVEQDWWDTDDAGGTRPIVELADHIVADIAVTFEGRVLATARSAVVTGSWGALGAD